MRYLMNISIGLAVLILCMQAASKPIEDDVNDELSSDTPAEDIEKTKEEVEKLKEESEKVEEDEKVEADVEKVEEDFDKVEEDVEKAEEESNEDIDVPDATAASEGESSTGDESSRVLEPTESVTEKKEEVPSKEEKTTSEMPSESEFVMESGPESTHAVRNRKGKICVLAKLRALFTIHYPTKQGEQVVYVEIPDNAVAKGKCGNSTSPALLRLNWGDFDFLITFSKFIKDDSADEWALTHMELKYDTKSPLFDQAINVGNIVAHSKEVELFKTECGKSFMCPITDIIPLHASNKKVATVHLKDLQLQPFDVEDGKFSPEKNCVVVESDQEEVVVDETAPLAVGLTLTTITLVVVLGFLIRRSYLMKKVDYNNMEE